MGKLSHAVERLARWWTSASQEERYQTLRLAIKENTPPLEQLQLAIIVAEVEAGEVAEG